MSKPLSFSVTAVCSSTRARVAHLRLKQPDCERMVDIETPVFMPVGTNGTMKGILPSQVEATACRLMLSNTYHLASRPGSDVVENAGGLHKFMNWPHALLTDSGGFQMVSLSKLMEVSEDGVTFTSPYDSNKMLSLPPEKATQIQHQIGANIIMQLDDVVSSTANDEKRFKEATERTIRWYERCKEAHKCRENEQNLFPIIQGGLDADLRRKCADEIVARDPPGIAIGGLSGGEEKEKFIRMVACSTESLPDDKPRYLMGVGFAVDMMLCVALGCDMFDCVYPTRTARFGSALIEYGISLNLKSAKMAEDFNVIESECNCVVCQSGYSRAYIHHLVKSQNTVGCHLLTQHNIRFQMRFMEKIRESIRNQEFENFIKKTLQNHYSTKENYPIWVQTALKLLNINT
ncbi:queuine tRNA-ribosyltransferase-like protein [Dinothrombium tinctorium]|uniref:Queuine tRNA-ribosyltransferase catalytic subunit 1 n=1 Tax=Dinothrombium tinctorium TaxID=1965070 RepID=A0A3S3P5V6_9ACAR|nr:queuine tRNA-ribosyltransferase-like protein [Dinothrombium tinctorium]RWS08640.1 queuine tRNA-ribosyltransferase-like protein [Dinothrombium tinctorium]